MVKERVELRLRFKEDEDLPPGEWLWAEPVRANHRGGAYRLLNSSVFAPVAVGDLVRASSDGGGELQITDLLRPSDRVLTAIEYPTTETVEDITRIADAWTEGTDGWSEGTPPVLFTIWAEGMRLEQIGEVLRRSIGGRAGWIWHGTALPGDWTRDRQGDVDFRLEAARDRLRRHP